MIEPSRSGLIRCAFLTRHRKDGTTELDAPLNTDAVRFAKCQARVQASIRD
jgi:hypothetical protein